MWFETGLTQHYIKFEKSLLEVVRLEAYIVSVKNKLLLSTMLISNFAHALNLHGKYLQLPQS